MEKIAIVGSGQAGLQLGFELLSKGYEVSLFSDRSPEQVYNGSTLPVPIQFYPSVDYEKNLRLNYWSFKKADHIDVLRINIYTPQGDPVLKVQSPLDVKAQRIDLRLKYSVWMREFEKRGGKLFIQEGTIELLEECTQTYDAVFVGTGRGELGSLFEKDESKSPFDKPLRHLVMFYLKNCHLPESNMPNADLVNFGITPGIGEFSIYNIIYKDQEECFHVVIESIPGGPLDIFDKTGTGAEQLERAKAYYKENCPPIYEILKDAEVVNNEWAYGAVTPTVNKPVGKLPSGRVVMAIGDALVLYDPIQAQGLNAASKIAHYIAERMEESPQSKFDEAWINEVFEGYWKKAKFSDIITNTMLTGMAPHQELIMFAASQIPEIASDFFNKAGDVSQLYPWFFEPEEAAKYLVSKGFVMNAAVSQ